MKPIYSAKPAMQICWRSHSCCSKMCEREEPTFVKQSLRESKWLKPKKEFLTIFLVSSSTFSGPCHSNRNFTASTSLLAAALCSGVSVICQPIAPSIRHNQDLVPSLPLRNSVIHTWWLLPWQKLIGLLCNSAAILWAILQALRHRLCLLQSFYTTDVSFSSTPSDSKLTIGFRELISPVSSSSLLWRDLTSPAWAASWIESGFFFGLRRWWTSETDIWVCCCSFCWCCCCLLMCALYSYSIISSIAKPSNNRYPFSRRKRKPMKLQTTTTMSHSKSNYKSPDSENLNPLRIRAQKNHRSAGSESQQSFLQKHTYINRFTNAQTHQHLPSKLFEFKTRFLAFLCQQLPERTRQLFHAQHRERHTATIATQSREGAVCFDEDCGIFAHAIDPADCGSSPTTKRLQDQRVT